MPRPAPYSPCKLFYDTDAPTPPAEGDYLVTPAGSAYWIQRVRPNPRRPHRFQLQCLRWPLAEVPATARRHPLIWYSRTPRASRRSRP